MTGSTETGKNPYVGPRSFEEAEHELFKGREEEIAILEGLVLSRRAVLFFAQSGAGKSSLLKAGLAPELKRQETIGRGRYQRTYQKMRVLPVLSVGGAIPLDLQAPVGNVFVFSALYSLYPNRDPVEMAGLSFSEGLAADFQEPDEETEAGASLGPNESSTLLIFDQLEELFTHHLERWQEREDFFHQVNQALEEYPSLHVLFSMREDHIAELTPYAHLLPEQLRPRFRMERLKPDAALQAVVKPAEQAGRAFAEGVAEALVDNLRRTQPGGDSGSDASSGSADQASLGEYVEPVHLQLVCRQLWQKLPPQRRLIEAGDVQDFGDVDKALTDFYEAAIASVVSATSLSERGLRTWFDRKLITPAHTRGLVYRDKTETEGLPNAAVDILNEAYIIRATTRGRDVWYELAHDRLVEPLLAANRAWLASHHNPLASATRAWIEAGRDPGKLLRGEPLAAADEHATRYPSDVLPEEKEFLAESRRAAEQRSAGRRRLLATMAVALILVLSGLTYWALRESYRATGNAATATANLATAVIAQSAARAAEETAKADRQAALISEAGAKNSAATATFSLATAVVAESIARTAQAAAEADRSLADARRLAAQGRGLLDVDERLAAQLAVESEAASPSWESSSLLLDLVLRTSGEIIQPYGPPIPSQESLIYEVSFSPDRQRLAWGTLQGYVAVWNYQENRIEWRYREHRGNVLSVAFSPDGKWLASGGVREQELFIWDVEAGAIVARLDADNRVYGLDFHPNQPWLAAVNLDHIRIFDTDTWTEIAEMRFPTEPDWISDIAWSPDGSLLAAAEFADDNAPNNGLVVWDVATRQQRLAFPKQRTLYGLDWTPDGRYLAAGSTDGTVSIVDMLTGREIDTAIPSINQDVRGVAFSPDGQVLVRGGEDQIITLFSTEGFAEIGQIKTENPARQIGDLEFFPLQGINLLAAAQNDEQAASYNAGLYLIAADNPLSTELAAGEGAPGGLAGLPDGRARLLRLSPEAGQALVTELGSGPQGAGGQETVRFQKEGRFTVAALSPGGDRLALSEERGPVMVYELPSGILLQTLRLDDQLLATSLAFNTDGTVLAAGLCAAGEQEDGQLRCLNGAVQLWESGPGSRVLGFFPLEEITAFRSLAFSQDGAWLAAGTEEASILLWDLVNFRPANDQPAGLPLARHKNAVTSLAFSPDGRRLASGSGDNNLILWDFETRLPVGSPLLGAQLGVTALAFREEGTLLAGYEDGRLLEWDVRVERWIELACGLAGARLSEEEQAQYFPGGGYRDVCGG